MADALIFFGDKVVDAMIFFPFGAAGRILFLFFAILPYKGARVFRRFSSISVRHRYKIHVEAGIVE